MGSEFRRLRRALATLGMSVGLVAGFGWIGLAGNADIVDVKVQRESGGTYRFIVAVRHSDEGWEHYADAWEVLTPDGRTVIATRKLLHPHVDEQPFTRSLSGVRVPKGVRAVIIRAHDSVHGYGGQSVRVPLP